MAISNLGSDISKLSPVTIEAVLPSYTTSTFVNAHNDAMAFIDAAASGIQTRLNPAGNPTVVLSPGVELAGQSDLTLTALDLTSWRFNGTTGVAAVDGKRSPAALTVRAAGSIALNGTISDGFDVQGSGASQRILARDDSSATLRFVAGSDLGSADPIAVDRNASGSITLGKGVAVRTGTSHEPAAIKRTAVAQRTPQRRGASTCAASNGTRERWVVVI